MNDKTVELPEGVEVWAKEGVEVQDPNVLNVPYRVENLQNGEPTVVIDHPGIVDLAVTVPEGVVCHALRTGNGHGNSRVHGDGCGDAIRDGSGDGDAIRQSRGDGGAIRDGDGIGDALRAGHGDGDAIRRGEGDGDAIHYGLGQGGARRVGGGEGVAVENGAERFSSSAHGMRTA